MSKEIFKKYNIKAKKSLGQNFLLDDIILEKIVKTLDLNGKKVVEVGPGFGALTEKLLNSSVSKLVLIEIDYDMIEIINQRIKKGELEIGKIDFNLEKIDVLDYYPEFSNYYLIANIPYYITSPILRHFLYEVSNIPDKMIILMQKDVAKKILGKGKEKSSVLSLFVQKKCDIKSIIEVDRKCFFPIPKVDSEVLLFEKNNMFDDVSDLLFLDLIKKGFKEPRKKLINNLSNSGYVKTFLLDIFDNLGLKNDIRGEDLSITEWCDLLYKIEEGN